MFPRRDLRTKNEVLLVYIWNLRIMKLAKNIWAYEILINVLAVVNLSYCLYTFITYVHCNNAKALIPKIEWLMYRSIVLHIVDCKIHILVHYYAHSLHLTLSVRPSPNSTSWNYIGLLHLWLCENQLPFYFINWLVLIKCFVMC